MGIMMVNSGDDVLKLNKKLRKQMHVTKSNVINQQVILQEGIKTINKINEAIAEPLIYLIDHQQIEFLYRTHKAKNEFSNLNSVGMEVINKHKSTNQAYLYCCNMVAQLATLAASLELS